MIYLKNNIATFLNAKFATDGVTYLINKVYQNNRPIQTSTMPCIVYHQLQQIPANTMNAASLTDDIYIQFDVYARLNDECLTVSNYLRSILDYASSQYWQYCHFQEQNDEQFDMDAAQDGTYKIIQSYHFKVNTN